MDKHLRYNLRSILLSKYSTNSKIPPSNLNSNDLFFYSKKSFSIIFIPLFPTISRFDPVSQVLGIRPGELFEIERSSKTAINTKFYRICST